MSNSRGRPPSRMVVLSTKSNGTTTVHMQLTVPSDIAKDLMDKGFSHAVIEYDPVTSLISYYPVALADLPVIDKARPHG